MCPFTTSLARRLGGPPASVNKRYQAADRPRLLPKKSVRTELRRAQAQALGTDWNEPGL